jgi:succinate dehydrogenase / fumarate reductase flavoprotein subunit/fumarate reductase (CoM/CoB) subunit A
MKEEGIDFRKHPVEFMTYDNGCQGRIVTNEKAETSLPGLYALGDELANGVSNASVFGWISGENAAKYSKEVDSGGLETLKERAEEKAGWVEDLLSRKDGADWKEVNVALQQIMQDHAGAVRSQALLEAGAFHLKRVKEKAHGIMRAGNPHEVGRCLEVRNLMELGELIFLAASDRKETRGNHVRVDYPLTNPRFNKKVHIVKKVDGKPVLEWREASK